jgi:O6-methylguanine-DNA--protein-cysteine methyltransferase
MLLPVLTFVTDLGTCGIRWSADGVTQVVMPRERGLVGRPFDTDDPDGIDPFRRSVLEATRAVGPGELVTYGELARAVGVPGGALTGFSSPGGVATKRRMLEIEGAPGFVQQPLFA